MGAESDDQTFETKAGRDQLAAQARILEAHLVAAQARGEDIPAEAAAMLASLRDVVSALDRLAASLAEESGPGRASQSPR